MADKADVYIVLAQLQVSVMTRDLYIRLAIFNIMASYPALTNSAGMLSTPADFPTFSALTTASTSSRRR